MAIIPSSRAADAKPYVRAADDGKAAIDLWLDANEGPHSLLGRLGLDRLPTALLAEAARRYPDITTLEDTLAAQLNLDRSRLLATAGGDDALARICQAVIDPGAEAIATTPTFEMIPRYIRLAGGSLLQVPWMTGSFPTDQIIPTITDRTRAIFIVTPNNPTGAIATARDLIRLSQAAPNALLIADLAYTEFADEDLTPLALSLPNAIIVRTFSKAWALAGLRIGYAAGTADVISWLRAVGQPYAVTGLSAALAGWAALNLRDAMLAGVAQVRNERDELTRLLRTQGSQTLDSHANFVLTKPADPSRLFTTLLSRGIAIRKFENRPDLEGWLRITCPGDPFRFGRLIRALKESA